MRKVSETVITAFLAGKSKTVANTYTDGETLFLHGNKIATNINGTIRIFDGGFRSNTTKERLNALIQLVNASGKYEAIIKSIYQKNFEWRFFLSNGDNMKYNDCIIAVAHERSQIR